MPAQMSRKLVTHWWKQGKFPLWVEPEKSQPTPSQLQPYVQGQLDPAPPQNLLQVRQIAKKLWETWLLLPWLPKWEWASKNQSPRGAGRTGREPARIIQITCFTLFFHFLKETLILRSVAEPITQHRFQTANYSGCFWLNIAGGKHSCNAAMVSVTTASCAMLIKTSSWLNFSVTLPGGNYTLQLKRSHHPGCVQTPCSYETRNSISKIV